MLVIVFGDVIFIFPFKVFLSCILYTDKDSQSNVGLGL